jgi:hypothetical protein
VNRKIEKIQIKDLPKDLIEKIEEEITPYAISLLGFGEDLSGEQTQLLGSGTLVRVEDKYGILTAQHVTPLLKKYKKIGLNLGTFEHKPLIESITLPIVEVGIPVSNSEGPDLAVIILPEYIIGTIKSKNLFWNISYHKKDVLSKPPDLNICLSFFCGTIEEWTKTEESTGGFGKVMSYRCLCGHTGVEDYWVKHKFDYLKLSVLYKDRDDLPVSFGGGSGGGIWGVVLHRLDDGQIISTKALLLGVAFYQTKIQNELRSIIGHGWRSIYENLPIAVKKTYAFL